VAERTVQFWQVTDLFHQPLPGIFPAVSVVERIADLHGEDRYVEMTDGMRLLGKALRRNAPQHVSLSRVRRDNLPSVEQDGSLDDLTLANNQNLAEATHFHFFERNVVGMLYNHDGPRASRLAAYLDAILQIQVSLAPVLDADVAKRLDQMGVLTSVTIGLPVARAYLLDDVLQDAAQIPHGLRELANASLAKTVHVKVVIAGSGSAQTEPRWRNFIRRVTTSPALEAFTKLEVHARGTAGDPGQTVDFVKEQLALKETVDLRSAQSRSVTDASAHTAIRDAYQRLKVEINQSVPPVGTQRSAPFVDHRTRVRWYRVTGSDWTLPRCHAAARRDHRSGDRRSHHHRGRKWSYVPTDKPARRSGSQDLGHPSGAALARATVRHCPVAWQHYHRRDSPSAASACRVRPFRHWLERQG